MNDLLQKDIEDEIWNEDVLNRREEAEYLIHFLLGRLDERRQTNQHHGYVLNVHAPWGHGKTFFLQRLAKTLQHRQHISVYINAWEDDFAEDPIVPFVSALDNEIETKIKENKSYKHHWKSAKNNIGKILIVAGKSVARTALKKVIGDGANEIAKIIEYDDEKNIGDEISDEFTEKIFEIFDKNKQMVSNFKISVKTFVDSIEKDGVNIPLFVVIDELDRCKPTYAISMLERIKHIFSIENTCFIIATDTDQLSKSVSAVYGEKFDGDRYLLRFFDRTYKLGEPALADFVRLQLDIMGSNLQILSSPMNNSHQIFIAQFCHAFQLGLRDIEQMCDIIRTVATTWRYNTKLELLYLLPLAHAIQQNNYDLFSNIEIRNENNFDESQKRMFGKWQIPADEAMPVAPRNTIPVWPMMKMLFRFSGMSLPSISVEPAGGDHSVRWVIMMFEREFRALHNSSFVAGAEPMSVLAEYPNAIRQAGKLMSAP